MRGVQPATADGRVRLLVVFGLLLLFVVPACSGLVGNSGATAPAQIAEATIGVPPVGAAGLASQPPSDWAGDAVRASELPPEAHATLALVAADGPYPYTQDGITFQNREGLLPDRRNGFYREYTVETPGSSDRGARRLVVGDDAAVYYTEDHYDSFRFVGP